MATASPDPANFEPHLREFDHIFRLFAKDRRADLKLNYHGQANRRISVTDDDGTVRMIHISPLLSSDDETITVNSMYTVSLFVWNDSSRGRGIWSEQFAMIPLGMTT